MDAKVNIDLGNGFWFFIGALVITYAMFKLNREDPEMAKGVKDGFQVAKKVFN